MFSHNSTSSKVSKEPVPTVICVGKGPHTAHCQPSIRTSLPPSNRNHRHPSAVQVMFIVGIISMVPSLLDFLPMTIKVADAPELDGVVPGPIYPLFGVLTAALAIGGGFMGVRAAP
eukprot:COSAG02_NODE_20749_length_817_cov_0.855153_2_plen_116_part_00